MRCPVCDSLNGSTTAFCTACGADLPPAPAVAPSGRIVHCKNDHPYDEALGECPYCPRPEGRRPPPRLARVEDGPAAPAGPTGKAGRKTEFESPPAVPAAGKAGRKTEFDGGPPRSPAVPGGPPEATRQVRAVRDPTVFVAAGAPKRVRPLRGWLVVLGGRADEPYKDYRLFEGANTIGREGSGATIPLRDPGVSWQHASLLNEGATYRLVDHQSKNGSWVGEQRVGELVLEPGAFLRFGETTLVFVPFLCEARP